MRAKLIVMLAGEPMRNPGEEVSGEEAVRLCAAGLAIPLRDEVEIETAETSPKRETATTRRKRTR
jgi:hypothetical protein